MSTLYLHIGIFKTGSSALQVFFAQNIECLKKDNIHYPELALVNRAKHGNITAGNGVWIARSLLPKNNSMAKPELQEQQMAILTKLLAEQTGTDILLSSEFFSDVQPTALENIAKEAAAHNYTLKIIGYVREQASYLESLYIQHVKRRCVTDGPETYIRALYPRITHLSFGSYFEELATLFGKENIIVKPYGKGDIFADFLANIGVNSKGYIYPERQVNLSLPPNYLPIFLELNKLQPNQSFSDQTVRDYAVLQASEPYPKATFIGAALRTEIESYFQTENQKLSEQWFNGDLLFSHTPPPYISIEEAASKTNLSTVINLLGGVVVQQEKRLNRMEQAIRTLNEKLQDKA